MRLGDVKVGVRVTCRRAEDGNKRTIGMPGRIVGVERYMGDKAPLVRFDRSVHGHGYKNREWYCGYRNLAVLP
jgi:hypothetical protein